MNCCHACIMQPTYVETEYKELYSMTEELFTDSMCDSFPANHLKKKYLQCAYSFLGKIHDLHFHFQALNTKFLVTDW